MFFFIWIHTDFVDPCLPLHYHFSQKLYLSTYLPVFFHLFTGQTAGRLERSSGTSNPKPPSCRFRSRRLGFYDTPLEAQGQGIYTVSMFSGDFCSKLVLPQIIKNQKKVSIHYQFYPTYSGHKYLLDNPAILDLARRNLWWPSENLTKSMGTQYQMSPWFFVDVHFPIHSMGLVYLPTVGHLYGKCIGKCTIHSVSGFGLGRVVVKIVKFPLRNP